MFGIAGNLTKQTTPDGAVSYTYNGPNKLIKGENDNGESSAYTYNALGARVENVQVRENQNKGHQNADLRRGSKGRDYLPFLQDLRAAWQRVWETEVGSTVQNDFETVTKHYVPDYLSIANRDIMVTEDGSYIQRYVYDENGTRISAEFSHADGTARGNSSLRRS